MASCWQVYCGLVSAAGAVFLVVLTQLTLWLLQVTDYAYLDLSKGHGEALGTGLAGLLYVLSFGICFYRGYIRHLPRRSPGYEPIPQVEGVELREFASDQEEI